MMRRHSMNNVVWHTVFFCKLGADFSMLTFNFMSYGLSNIVK